MSAISPTFSLHSLSWDYFNCFTLLWITVIAVVIIHYRRKIEIAIFEHDSITSKIVSDTDSCIQALNELNVLNPHLLGLDCEWIGKNKISLLQIAHPKLILLIRLHKLQSIPVELIGLLTNNTVLKCGVGIYNDAAKLRHDYSIDVAGCIDINDLFGIITNNQQLLSDFYHNYSIESTKTSKVTSFGLNTLSKILLKQAMKYKDKMITKSNWERYTLTKEQCQYAADDAWIGFQLFKRCMELSDINDTQQAYMHFCYGIIDTRHINAYAYTHRKKKSKLKSNSNSTCRKKAKKNGHQGKSKAFFDNCKILKPDGNILSCCSMKGMQWYVKKGLATVIDDKTIKLTFEPNIRGLLFDEYHQTIKISQCFVCGKSDNLCKFAVVPECYRQFIDSKYNDKAWRIHDHIPLCVICHKKGMQIQNKVRTSLCHKYNVPHFLFQVKDPEYVKLTKTTKAAWVLAKKSNKIPIKRKIILLQEICHFYKLEYEVIYQEKNEDQHVNGDKNDSNDYDNLIKIKNDKGLSTSEILKMYIAKLNEKQNENVHRKQWLLHSKKLVEVFKENQVEFIELWRQAFVDHMKPRFLPEIWSISAPNV